MEKTLGEKRVRIDFNVKKDDNVSLIKQHIAQLIDICETLKAINPSEEKTRAFEIAQQELESAAHWAVKGYTF